MGEIYNPFRPSRLGNECGSGGWGWIRNSNTDEDERWLPTTRMAVCEDHVGISTNQQQQQSDVGSATPTPAEDLAVERTATER